MKNKLKILFNKILKNTKKPKQNWIWFNGIRIIIKDKN